MPGRLNKNILATIIYYDGLDYPLTAFEVWKYLIRTDYYAAGNQTIQVTLSEVVKQLADDGLAKYVEHFNGFYFLKGQKHLVSKRIANSKISTGKLSRLLKITRRLRFVPFVRMVAVSGKLAMKNAHLKSDWDVFIVLKSGKIWVGRTLVTLFLHIFKQRRHGKKTADRVCLNFFVTDQSLEVITKDLFSANEYMFLFPLYGWEVYNKFQIKNQWIRQMKPTYALTDIPPLKTISDSRMSESVRRIGEMLFSASWLEKWLKKIEKKRIMANPKTLQEGSLIYADDDALVFLPDPHGPLKFEKFKETVARLGV